MNKIDAVIQRLPRNAYSQQDNADTKLYKLVKAIVDEFNITMENINRIDNLLGIDTAEPDDIYIRFGALLNIKQNPYETAEQYRNRLKTSVTALSGGTAEAIKYAVACGLGINNDNEAMDNIHIYDAWEYPEDVDVVRDYGYIVCSIDLNAGRYSTDVEQTVKRSAENVKAAGTIIQFIYYNFRIEYYIGLDSVTYINLSTLTYNQVGE